MQSEFASDSARILVTGGETLIGGAIAACLERRGYQQVYAPTPAEVDWLDARAAAAYFAEARPGFVFHADGKTAGILGNQRFPADLMLDNLLRQTHVIRCSLGSGVRKLLYLASSCSYPKHCPQPMQESRLLTGPLEPTNEAYAVAKLAGVKLCQACRQQYGAPFIVGIPANAFGPGDDFDPEDSHVIGALIRRFDAAKREGAARVTVWGTGTPRREFIYAPDLAEASVAVMQAYDDHEPINLGTGTEVSIAELAAEIRDVVGFRGELVFDPSKPDGMPRKSLDSSKLLALGWRPRTPLREAITATYAWYRECSARQGAAERRDGPTGSHGQLVAALRKNGLVHR